MQFDSISAFLHMGGYAFYVWLSYSVSVSCLLILVINSMQQKQRVLKKIAKRINQEQRLKQIRSAQE